MMGERVAVNRGGTAGEPQPRRVVPLGYGRGDHWFARMRRNWAPFSEAVGQVVRNRLGGWRRVGFAFGVSLTAGGFAYGLAAPYHADETGFLTAVGGLLIGLTVPIRALDEPRP